MIQIITIGLSAFLLFMLQPMISKIILPDFGGGSSIWLTSLIFFQLLLLGGYSFSHFLASKLKPLKQGIVYGSMIFLSLFFIPIQIQFRQAHLAPVLHIFVLLLFTIGLPYFLLSTTSPMVQSWIAADPVNRKRNPYILYGVSNAGSLLGLLIYPTLIETNLTNSQQTGLLSYGYGLFTFFILLSLAFSLKARKGLHNLTVREQTGIPDGNPGNDILNWKRKLGWMGQAMVPSAALMVFTHHLSVDIVNFPLLWVIPLSLYLISFIIVFLKPITSKPSPTRTFLIILPVLFMTLSLRSEISIPFIWNILAACICLFAICMFFHGNLERSKPAPRHLTSFYLYLSLGGTLGSTLAGIVAPMIFKSNLELYIVIITAFYFILLPYFEIKQNNLKKFFQALAALLLILAFFNEEILQHHHIIYRTRSFFGTYTIRQLPYIPGRQRAARVLSQGTTVHGGQTRGDDNCLIPIFYFHKDTGVGHAFTRLDGLKNVGVVGLGTGMVSLYAKPGQRFDFFEIDPAVVRLAKTKFDNLKESKAVIRHFIGDARIELRSIPDNSYDLLVLDAFTSGAIPTHLLTTEAMKEYFRVLRRDGVIMFHITNRYINLLPVLNCAAQKLDLYLKYHQSFMDAEYHKFPARWAILTRDKARFEKVTSGSNGQWQTPPAKKICWTDEFSNLWSVIDIAD